MATIRCLAPTWGIRTSASPLLSSHPSAANQACLPKQINTKIISKRLFLHNYARDGSNLVMSAMSNPQPQPTSLSPSETIEQFYICINDKDLKKLHKFISSDCWFDDYSFPSPFEGQKEVMHYLEQLLACSGKHVKFNVGSICERATKGGKFTVGVTWHLEWKEKPIPSPEVAPSMNFQNKEMGYSSICREAQAVIESPIKPGTLALTLLKMVSSIFDTFPNATERFLQAPLAIIQLLSKIYNIFLKPFIHPLLRCYINSWKFATHLISYALKILLNISKLFPR